jgi:ribosomal protein S18 acetylase RimI-like enzyme
VHVTVAKASTRALGFYHRLGFRPLEIAEPGETTVTVLGRKL